MRHMTFPVPTQASYDVRVVSEGALWTAHVTGIGSTCSDSMDALLRVEVPDLIATMTDQPVGEPELRVLLTE